MDNYKDKEYLVGTTDYDKEFWNMMRGSRAPSDVIEKGMDLATGGYALPKGTSDNYEKAVKSESIFRNLATVVKAFKGSGRIFAYDNDDLGEWIPEGGEIHLQDGMNDFTRYSIDMHKLAVFVRLDSDFVYDAAFSIKDYLTGRIAKNIAKTEDAAFLNGDGENMPTGILHPELGAGVADTVSEISFDDIIRLYFALDDEYRKKAVWIMNDETALKLRLMKDKNGNHLWNHANDTIFGKPVIISKDMPSEEPGTVPVIFGDFSYYWIILRSPISMRTLTEKFVKLDQIGYLATAFLDAKLIRREAVKAIQIVS